MKVNTKQLSLDHLLKVFQYPERTSLSIAIILSALSIDEPKKYLRVKVYRNNAFSVLWKKQFHHGSNWKAQFRSELNQGENRLAFRVFESPDQKKKGFKYRLKKLEDLNEEDLKTVNKLIRTAKDIKKGRTLLDNNNEEIFQNSVQISSPVTLPKGKVVKPARKKVGSGKQYIRNPKISKRALMMAKYKCEYDHNHETFYYPSTEINFMEAHHLIPMKYQAEFSYSIDVQENVISICPNCHRKIHKSSLKSIKEMAEKLFTGNRKEKLSTRGIDIDLKQLMGYYKNNI